MPCDGSIGSIEMTCVWLLASGTFIVLRPDLIVDVRAAMEPSIFLGTNDIATVRRIGVAAIIMGVLVLALLLLTGKFCI